MKECPKDFPPMPAVNPADSGGPPSAANPTPSNADPSAPDHSGGQPSADEKGK
jgi:hypothetical protein